jgi:hypothetical protein
MATANDSSLPSGVSITREWSSQIQYQGTETALLASGLIRAEWIEGLGRFSRQIAIDPAGGFQIVGEGKGSRLTHAHRDNGALTIKRLPDGNILVGKFRTITEERDIEQARQEEWAREREQKAWITAKVARGERDFLAEWKDNILRELNSIARLSEGELIYTGFPEIKLSVPGLAKVRAAVAQLTLAIAEATPQPTDLEVKNNVIILRPKAYAHMAAA